MPEIPWLKRAYSLPLIVAAAFILALLLVLLKPSTEQDADADVAKSVHYIEVKSLPTRNRTLGFGEVKPAISLEANAQVAGRVIHIHPGLRQGGSLEKGEIALKLDTVNAELKLNEAKANLAVQQANLASLAVEEENTKVSQEIAKRNYQLAQKEFNRKTQLKKKGTISQSTLDAEQQVLLGKKEQLQSIENTLSLIPSRRLVIEAQVTQAEAQVKENENNLKNATVTMPFTGRIGNVWVEVDEYVNVGSKLFDANNIGRVEIHAQIPLQQARPLFSRLKDHLKVAEPTPESVLKALDLDVRIRLVGGAIKSEWQGEVVRLGESMDQTSRTLSFIVAANGAPGQGEPGERPPLLKGMYTEVELLAQPVDRIVIPRQAIHQGKVYVINQENRLAIKPIELSFVQGELAIVESGLSVGDRIVVTDIVPAVESMLLEPIQHQEKETWIAKLASGEASLK